jgi:hypothetical protein
VEVVRLGVLLLQETRLLHPHRKVMPVMFGVQGVVAEAVVLAPQDRLVQVAVMVVTEVLTHLAVHLSHTQVAAVVDITVVVQVLAVQAAVVMAVL